MRKSDIDTTILENIKDGMVIPAQPLALDSEGKLDIRHQRALTRYYLAAGAGGIACAVHSTQFEIRDPKHNLLQPVLEITSKTIDECDAISGNKTFKVAGVCGKTEQALSEAKLAKKLGYHAVLLSLSALKNKSVPELLEHCKSVANVMPVIGFYLQPSVGGRILPYDFWRGFMDIENVIAVKIAPFNRYQTFDVVRALCEAGKENEITLYTGNDDNIVIDLLSEYEINTETGVKKVHIKGGLLGHWCVWTRKAVELLNAIKAARKDKSHLNPQWLTQAIKITDSNAAFFDTANNFAGCIPGLHEVLMRQGLMQTTKCLNPDEVLSPGQKEEIDRIYNSYPELNDDDFVKQHLTEWLAD